MIRKRLGFTLRAHPTRASARSRLAIGFCLLLLVTIPVPVAGDKAGASPLITDKVNLPLSNQFGPPNQFGLTGSGDVFFTPRQTALFRWDSGSGTRTRLLQAGDRTAPALGQGAPQSGHRPPGTFASRRSDPFVSRGPRDQSRTQVHVGSAALERAPDISLGRAR